MEIKVSGIIHEKTSKNGKPYTALDIQLTPNYTKTIFLEDSDLEVVKLYLENQSLKNNNAK